MGQLDIRKSIKVNTNAQEAWEIIGPNFLNIADWGRGVIKSWDSETAEKKFPTRLPVPVAPFQAEPTQRLVAWPDVAYLRNLDRESSIVTHQMVT